MTRIATALALSLLVLGACRGQTSEKPPLYIFPDMDWQPKIQGQEEFKFAGWADGRGNRPPVAGTVAQGDLREDDLYYRGRSGALFVAKAPIEVDEKTILRGEERFNIYCTPCHDRTGSGRGMVVRRGYPAAADLTNMRTRGMSDGELFDIMTNGVRNMPPHAYQVPVADRWAIVVWMRVLQRSQHGKTADVPADRRGNIEPAATPQ